MLHRTVSLALCALGTLAFAAGGTPAPPSHGVEPKADEVLRAMGETLASARSFGFHARTEQDRRIEKGPMVELSADIEVDVRRPARMHATRRGDDVDRESWYDGSTLTLLDRREKAYASTEVPPTLGEMFDFMVKTYDLILPLAELCFAKPYERLIQGVEKGVYLGEREVEGRPCHHLAFRQEGLDWQIWIAAGETPLPLKVVITYREEAGEPQYEATLSGWDLKANFPESTFEFNAPPGARRVEMESLLKPGKEE